MFMRCFKVVIIVFIMVMTTSCNPCLFAVTSCTPKGYTHHKGYDVDFYIKNNVDDKTKIEDIRYCLSISCPEEIKNYNFPNEKGNYIQEIRKILNDSPVANNCLRNSHFCMENKGYSKRPLVTKDKDYE
ncbi:TPA: hypothetical protein ACFRG5_002173 [Neisseria lactamica]